jgi:hypothetical protein
MTQLDNGVNFQRPEVDPPLVIIVFLFRKILRLPILLWDHVDLAKPKVKIRIAAHFLYTNWTISV